MTKVTLNDISGLGTAGTLVNSNNSALETFSDTVLSRDGTEPNYMEADLDMNSNRILNLPAATTDTQPVRKKEFDEAVFGTLTDTPETFVLKTYSSMSEMDSDLTIGSDVTAIQLLGYDTVGDGGKALYTKVVSEPAHAGKLSKTNDNGDTVWFELDEDIINPYMFGAKGDGVTSDTAALKSFFKCAEHGYKRLYLPPGDWNHDSLTDRVDIYDAEDITVFGAGREVTHFHIAGSLRPFVMRKIDGLLFKDIHISSSKVSASYGLEVGNCTNVTIEKNHFEGGTQYALGIYEDPISVDTSGATQSGTHTLYSRDPVDGTLTSMGTCTITVGTTTTVNFTAHGFSYGDTVQFTTTGTLPSPLLPSTTYEVLSTTANTFSIVDGPLPCDNLIIRDNLFEDAGFYGIEHFPKVVGNTCEIYNNIFKHCAYDPMNFGTAPYAIKAGQSTYRTRIFNNKIYAENATKSSGIALANYFEMEVFGNEIWDYDYTAIGVSATEHEIIPGATTFASCYIHDNTVGCTKDTTRDGSQATFAFGSDEDVAARMGPVIWANNVVVYDTGVQLWKLYPTSTTSTAQNNLKILNNIVFSRSTSQNMIDISNSLGAIPTGVEIRGNYFYGENTSSAVTVGRYNITGAADTIITDNTWVNAGRNVIAMTTCTGDTLIARNLINGYNVDNTASSAAFAIADTSSSSVYRIRNNTLTTGDGHLKVIVSCASANPKFYLANNVSDDLNCAEYSGSLVPLPATFASSAGRRWFAANAAPASGGPYAIGDITWNTIPAASGTVGWVCTTGGSPGTWKTFGTIAS